VQHIWRVEGLKVPAKQPKRGRLWLADGSCICLRPERRNHVWAYDFVSEQPHDGRKLCILTMIDEYTASALSIRVARRFTSNDVLYTLSDLFLEYGVPEHISSDNGSEFVTKAVRKAGLPTLASSPCSSSPQARGRTATSNRSMANCATSASMARSS
jgi:putative transposase